MNPIDIFLEKQGVLVLDGGLATELEARGYNLQDKLWSARLLLEEPEAIRQLHYDYLMAGADCVISASYQASLPGFAQRGISPAQAKNMLRSSVRLACDARDEFWRRADQSQRLYPLVAGSIGPYGAFLADGSEYGGDYGVTEETLYRFHRPRWHVLATAGADLLAVETLPSWLELQALVHLIKETPETSLWVSFSCRDEAHLWDGTPLAKCVALLAPIEQVVAVGVNCTSPRYISDLIRVVQSATDKPVVAYPNSGEMYDPQQKVWIGERMPAKFAEQSKVWWETGAALIGGCCRTMPAHITQIRQALLEKSS